MSRKISCKNVVGKGYSLRFEEGKFGKVIYALNIDELRAIRQAVNVAIAEYGKRMAN